MSTETTPTTHTAPPPKKEPKTSPSAGLWKWTLLSLGLIAAVMIGSVLLARARASRQLGPKLTHTITRGDLVVTVVEQGMVESAENTEIKCQVRGHNTVLWVVESGTVVKPGDELVRLDSLYIQEQIDERTKYAHWSRSAAERSKANVKRSELAVSEYAQGRYVAELMEKEKDVVVAKASLRAAENMRSHAERMAESEYISKLEVEEKEFAVQQAKLDVDVKEMQIKVLKEYTQREQLQTLKGNLASTQARHEANAERAIADASRRDRALAEVKHCVVLADRGGLVIHPNAAEWKFAPIAEGSTVHKDQVLLLMPDLSQMQVKVGIHESVIDRMKKGLIARVRLPEKELAGKVSAVASVTRPAGWWTGNEVRYDTLVALPNVGGLRPGMSAEVELIIAEYENVVTIPVAALVETEQGFFCWVRTSAGSKKRKVELGDSNDVFTIVHKGLQEGEQVVLNPLSIDEARTMAATNSSDEDKASTGAEPVGKKNRPLSKPAGKASTGKTKPQGQGKKNAKSKGLAPQTKQ